MMTPSTGSRMQGPPDVAAVPEKCVAALAGVAGDPSSGVESMNGAVGKSMQAVVQACWRPVQLPLVGGPPSPPKTGPPSSPPTIDPSAPPPPLPLPPPLLPAPSEPLRPWLAHEKTLTALSAARSTPSTAAVWATL